MDSNQIDDNIDIIDINNIQHEINTKIIKLLNQVSEGDEFEASFKTRDYKITLEKYIIILKYLVKLSKENEMKLEKQDYLNISYNYDYQDFNNYRITVDGLQNINDNISNIYQRENHIIFSMLLNKSINGDKTITIMKKLKDNTNKIDIDFLRFRLSKEQNITKQEENKLIRITEKERKYINFRYIQRVSLIIEDNDDYIIRIDLSQVKMADKITMLEKMSAIIELEIDISFKRSVSQKIIQKALTIMGTYLINIKMILQKSNKLVSKALQTQVITNLKKLIFIDQDVNIKDLPAMQTQAAEIPHIVDIIPNKYAVSDKADGERTFLFISKGNIYLISNTLEVKEIDNSEYLNINDYNDSIIDGEYLYIPKYKKFVFLAFDILIYKGVNIRTESKLEKRIDKIYEITKELFKQQTQIKKYTEDFDLEKLKKFHQDGLRDYLNELNNKLENNKTDNIIMCKYIIIPTGGHSCEVYTYSSLIWNIYTKDNKFQCPYTLDGIIYTGLEQEYTRNISETKYTNYKWKPGTKNSLDFYVLYERNKETNQILTVYDDTDDTINNSENSETIEYDNINNDSNIKTKGALYRILNLYVGKMDVGREYPILFQKETNNYIANIYLQDDQVRDIEGNIIEDATVVEFSYINDPMISPGFRWVPLRTRFDKTDSVNLYRRKYGNNNVIADKTWRSIMDGIEISDIDLLGNITSYEIHNKKLKSKITTDVITMERRDNIYYQVITNLAKPLRHFHNWIKSNLIYSYCSPKQGKKLDILDYGCGQGGDTLKFYHARVNSYIGFDFDSNGIYSGSNGALSRYQTFKKKMPNCPTMKFLVADGSALLTYENQKQALGTMTEQNKKMFDEYFGEKYKTYDVINCQFAFHYFLKNDITFNNALENFKKFLKPSGYILITTFDGDLVNASFDETDRIVSYYTTMEGKKKILFDVIKKYNKEETNLEQTGLAIDVHLPTFADDKYETEYLISSKFLIRKMKENGINLVDTGYFGNIYEQHRDFFEKVAKGEENPKNKKYYMTVKEFYNMEDTVNYGSYQFSKLNRYYIFQKEDVVNNNKYVYKPKPKDKDKK